MWAKTRSSLAVCVLLITLPSIAQAAVADSLVVNLRLRLGQTTVANSNWTDAQLYKILNDAQDYISGIGRSIETDSTRAGGTLRITAPTNFVALKDNSYLWRNGAEIKAIPRVSMDSLNKIMTYMTSADYGRDKYVIAEDGGVILVAPTLNAADSVVISYYGNGATLATGVECGYGNAWEQVLLMAAKAFALEKISSPEMAFAVAERDKAIAAMFQSRTLRPQLGGSPVGD
jgi:hypothetical protein